MLKTLTSLLLLISLGGAVSVAGWWTLFLRGRFVEHEAALAERQERIDALTGEVAERDVLIDELGVELEEKEARIQELDLALSFLKTDHRLARLEVLDQETTGDGRTLTRIRFIELGPDGTPLGPGRDVEVEGRLVYVDTLVIKFGDDYVESGDSLRGTSICLFRRLFGEDQSPSEGVALESLGTQPLTYADDQGPDSFHTELWKSVWDYANDPELARKKGVRASHGEAPFIEARPGKSYRLELRSSGGLSIRVED